MEQRSVGSVSSAPSDESSDAAPAATVNGNSPPADETLQQRAESVESVAGNSSSPCSVWSRKALLSTWDPVDPSVNSAALESLADTVSRHRCGERQDVLFEVVEARIVCDEKTKRFVLYTLAVKRSENVGDSRTLAGEVERRYSDFLALYEALRRRHPDLAASVSFPRKALMGNFRSDVIEARCRGFARFVTAAYLQREVRLSPVFGEFLFSRDGRHGHRLMTLGAFRDAAGPLLNCQRITESLFGLRDPVAFVTLCLVVACLNACDEVAAALCFAERAVAVVGGGWYARVRGSTSSDPRTATPTTAAHCSWEFIEPNTM